MIEMLTVYTLTLRQLTGRWRLLIMTLLATLPVLVTAVALQSSDAPGIAEFETLVLSAMYAGSIIPLVVLAIASAAFADEIEDRTLANLTLASIPRWQIVLPKLLAAVSLALPFVAVSALITARLAFLNDPTATLAVVVSALTAVALYAAAFVFLGLVSTHAIGVGLVYIVLWEGFFSGYVSGVRMLSIRHHTIALMHGMDPRRFASTDHMDFALVVATSVAVFAALLLLTVRRLKRIDVP